jgi:hypothetical protein
MNSHKAVIFIGAVFLSICSSAFAVGVPEPNKPNLNNDNIVDFYDFALMSENWQQTGAGLAGDFDDSNTVDIDDLLEFCWYWLSHYSEYQQCQGTGVDLDSDGIIAFEDLAKFAQNWLVSGAGLTGDFDDSNSVDCNDLSIFADCWLKGSRPESIWEQFKSALATRDVDTAVSFFADSVAYEYSVIFEELYEVLPTMANGMGELFLIYSDANIARYEMLRDEGGGVIASFPVYFCRGADGSWKIYCF